MLHSDRFRVELTSQRSPWLCRRSFLERKQAHKIKIKCQGHAPNVILNLSGENTRSIAPTNVVDFGAKLTSAQKGMHSEHVTQSNGGVVQKSSIRKLPIVPLRRRLLLGRHGI